MPLPIFRLPKWTHVKEKMIDNQPTRALSRPPSSAAAARRCLAGVFSAALLLYGCSTPQPVRSNEAPPPVIAVVAAPTTESISPVVPEGQAMIAVATENNVFFALRSATVDAADREKLRQHADRLKSNRRERVLLVGHSDDQGSRNYNLAITEERIMAVQKLLRSYGVSARQIRRNRIGSVKPLVPCATKECQQQMRRVELVYLP